MLKKIFKKNIDNDEKDLLEGELLVDVYMNEVEQMFVVVAPMAGVKKKDIKVYGADSLVRISGKREYVFKGGNIDDYEVLDEECLWGRFYRQIKFPVLVNFSKSYAVLEDGIFTLYLPYLEAKDMKKMFLRKIFTKGKKNEIKING